MKEWKHHPDSCGMCGGGPVEIHTEAEEHGWGYDSDDMRCLDCGAEGSWIAYEDGYGYSNWEDSEI